jgi:hypothetical protein
MRKLIISIRFLSAVTSADITVVEISGSVILGAVYPASAVHKSTIVMQEQERIKKIIYMSRLCQGLGCLFSILERNIANLLGDFLLGTSSSGELCPSEMQKEPVLDTRLLTDFAGLGDRRMGLEGGEGGEPSGLYMGGVLVDLGGDNIMASKSSSRGGSLGDLGASSNDSSLDTFHRNRRSATFFS